MMRAWPRLAALLAAWLCCLPLAAQAEPATPPPLDPAQVLNYLRQHPGWLNRHPDVLEAARQAAAHDRRLQERGRVQRALQAHAAVLRHPALARAGGAQATVRILEFTDYRCPPCRTTSGAVNQLLAADPQVQVVVLPLPLFGDESQYAARVAFAAQQQGRFWPMHERLWVTPVIDRRSAMGHAQALQMDPQRLLADLNSPQWPALQAQIADLARALKVTGLPALVVGDLMLVGGVDEPMLKQAVASARCLNAAPSGATLQGSCHVP
jgi:protein-disulfide isomerase